MRSLFLLLTAAVAVNGRCRTGFIQGPSLSDCYKFVTKGAHWYAAEWRCTSLGGHLTSVSSALASSFLKEEVPSCCSGQYWIGGSNDDQDATWEWSDGTQFGYSDWDASQPATGSPLCLAASTSSGKWSAQPCYQSRSYVCKVPALEDTCPTPMPQCNNGFNTNGPCTCGTAFCTVGQICDQASSTCTIPLPACPAPPATAPVEGCECGPVSCTVGQTCDASTSTCSTPLAVCPAPPDAAPAAGCKCGTASCTDDQTCDAPTSTCTFPAPPCVDNTKLVGTCVCGSGAAECSADQYCNIAKSECVNQCAVGATTLTADCECDTKFCASGNVCSAADTCTGP